VIPGGEPASDMAHQQVKTKKKHPSAPDALPVDAERGGFEPPVQFPIRQFSKLLV
jgi:hypothetical protein